MSRRPACPANARACAAVATAVVAAIGCGGADHHDAHAGGETYVVAVERVRFPARQRIGQRSAFAIAVRNAGDATIPNLSVTLHGFSRRATDSRNADPSVSLWTIDRPPPGSQTAIEDTWATGALRPGRRATLRWRVTAIAAGTHALSYSIAPSLQGSARARTAGGAVPRGRLAVTVDAAPVIARVDPLTGAVTRHE